MEPREIREMRTTPAEYLGVKVERLHRLEDEAYCCSHRMCGLAAAPPEKFLKRISMHVSGRSPLPGPAFDRDCT
jgi:hypothetical protein